MFLRAFWMVLFLFLVGCGTLKRIGESCIQHGDCPSQGSLQGRCAVNLPGGYCTRGCVSDRDCDPGTICIATAGGLACVRSCTSAIECRINEGYSCTGTAGANRKFCYVP